LLADRVNKINESPTMRVATEAKRMQAEGINVIDFSVGEPDFPTPFNIKEAAKTGIDDNHTKYTAIAGTVELRKAIAKKLKSDNNLDYDISEIIVTSGAKQSVFNALFAIVNKGEEVIIPAPYWVSYPDMVSMADGTSVFVETDEKNGFRITPDLLENAITNKTKALILCNPSNPTGSAYSKKELEDLAAVCLKHNFYIISDEIYEKLIYDNFEFVSFAALGPEIKKRTILVNGVSKSYSMTGWRIGYTAGPKDVISAMNKIQSHSTSHPSSVSQFAAVEALTGSQSTITEMITEYKKRRDYLYDQLVSIDGITCYKPEGAFFLFPNVSVFFGLRNDKMKITNSFDLAMYLLMDGKIAVVPGTGFGAEGFLRISYATSMENIIEASRRFKETVQHLKP
jgi:aspartate aminotransferase